MTLQAFTLATLRKTGTDFAEPMLWALDTATRLTAAMDAVADASIRNVILGCGLIWHQNDLHPLVLANYPMLGRPPAEEPVGLSSVPAVQQMVHSMIGMDDMVGKTLVQGVTVGFRHANVGDPILSAGQGRAGAPVEWGNGRTGFLTAGHVAPAVGGVVTDTGNATLGTVLWSRDPANPQSTTPEPDVALVETLTPPPNSPVGLPAVIAAAGDPLELVGAPQSTAEVLGFCSTLRFGPAQGNYGQSYLADLCFTNPGDSGGLVTSSGTAVGHVVGGFSGRNMTVVQDIGYQVSEVRKRSKQMIRLI